MAKKRSSTKKKASSGSFFTRGKCAVFAVLLALVGGGGVGVWLTPPSRRQEVRYLLYQYQHGDEPITTGELLSDVWELFDANVVKTDYRGKDAMVYGGDPKTRSSQTLRILTNNAYRVGYDEIMRNPAWVAYKLRRVVKDAPMGERPESFETDLRTIAQVASSDYTGSGYDRGHMAPNWGIAHCYGLDAQRQTFLMSNIVPQRHRLNDGLWKQLEQREATSYVARFHEVWVLCGPVYHAEHQVIGNGTAIPAGFFKIIVDEMEDGVRALAFRFNQEGDAEDLEAALTTIDDIEEATSLDFFPELEDNVQKALESTKARSIW
jgi:endonuclease G